MLDIKLIRNDPELVKENIRKKFQDAPSGRRGAGTGQKKPCRHSGGQ